MPDLMRTRLKYLPAVISMLLACGGEKTPNGSTVANANTQTSLMACIDVNPNWHCDDGDISSNVKALGPTGLAPKDGKYVLIEARDMRNQRTALWVSQASSNEVTALSTLRSRLSSMGKTPSQVAALEDALGAKHGPKWITLLQQSFEAAHALTPLNLKAIDIQALAVATQTDATIPPSPQALSLSAPTTQTIWRSDEPSGVQRRLSVQGSLVLGHSESNRLYLFDTQADEVSPTEIDLIPGPPEPNLAKRALAWLDKAVSIFVDTASAATAFVNPPTPAQAPALPAGKGISQLALVDEGRSAFVLMNMLSNQYQTDDCAKDGFEGLFKVSLTEVGSARWLGKGLACVHSGLSLITADAKGQRVLAWNQATHKLWVIDGNTLQRQAQIDFKWSAGSAPQALAITPGGRYLASATAGRLSLVDLQTARVLTQLSGAWGNVAQMRFAQGGRTLLLASQNQMHTVTLDNALQLIDQTQVDVAPADQTLYSAHGAWSTTSNTPIEEKIQWEISPEYPNVVLISWPFRDVGDPRVKANTTAQGKPSPNAPVLPTAHFSANYNSNTFSLAPPTHTTPNLRKLAIVLQDGHFLTGQYYGPGHTYSERRFTEPALDQGVQALRYVLEQIHRSGFVDAAN